MKEALFAPRAADESEHAYAVRRLDCKAWVTWVLIKDGPGPAIDYDALLSSMNSALDKRNEMTALLPMGNSPYSPAWQSNHG